MITNVLLTDILLMPVWSSDRVGSQMLYRGLASQLLCLSIQVIQCLFKLLLVNLIREGWSSHANCVRCSSAGVFWVLILCSTFPHLNINAGLVFPRPGPTSGERWAPCPHYRHLLELRGCLSHVLGACFHLINDRTCRLETGCKVMTQEGPRGSSSMMKMHLFFRAFLD